MGQAVTKVKNVWLDPFATVASHN